MNSLHNSYILSCGLKENLLIELCGDVKDRYGSKANLTKTLEVEFLLSFVIYLCSYLMKLQVTGCIECHLCKLRM